MNSELAFMPWRKIFVYGLLAMVAVLVYSWIMSPLIVTVTGVGEVSSKAETAVLTFTLSSSDQTPQGALANVKSTSNKIRETLKTSGIADSDIYESQAVVVPASANNSNVFQATISMGLKTNKINNLDGLTSQLYAQGAFVVSQPVLSVGNIDALEKEAYNLAIKDAKKKAGSLALSNWKLLRKVVLIEQSQTQPTSTVTSKAGTTDQVEKNLSPDDGIIKISKVVSVSYKMW